MNSSVNLSGKGKMSSNIAKAKNRKKALKRLLTYVTRNKLMLILALLLTIISNGIQILGPKISGDAISQLDGGINNINLKLVFIYCMIMVGIYVVSAVLSYLLNILMVHFSQKIIKQMRKELFDHISNMPISFFDRTHAGDIISRMSYDIDTINTSLSSDIVTVLSSMITIVGSLVMMIIIEPLLVLIFVVTVPICLLFTRFMRKRLRKKYRQRSITLGNLNGYAEEMITGMKTIKSYSNEEKILDKYETLNELAADAYCQADCLAAWNGPGVNFINNVCLSLISMIGSIMYMYSFRNMDIGKITSFVLYSRKFSGPINEIANILSDIESALAASERIFDILDMPIEKDEKDCKEITNVFGDIEFKNVKFGYNNDIDIIHDLSLNVKRGSLVAIVGPTGAGKTTIINLLMRFYDVKDGTIKLDGIDINKIKKKSLRKQFSMVLQDTWLKEGTILDNVRYASKDKTKEDVIEACRLANIDDYIESLPLGYDTILHERGDNISKGQKQLLTIARAMLIESNLLILDEATSNVDTNTEMKIQDAMRKLMEDKTCFVIAHRLSTIKHADIILVLKDGDIVEQGTHNSLIQKKGFYASLYNSQFN